MDLDKGSLSVMEINILSQLREAGGELNLEDLLDQWDKGNWEEVETTLYDLEAASFITMTTVYDEDLEHTTIHLKE